MKKYIKPITTIDAVDATTMICVSLPIGGDQNNPTGEIKNDYLTEEDINEIFNGWD